MNGSHTHTYESCIMVPWQSLDIPVMTLVLFELETDSGFSNRKRHVSKISKGYISSLPF